MGNKANILQLVYGFGVGGGELKLLELISNFNRNKYNITIVAVGLSGPLEEKFKSLELPVYMLPKAWRFDFGLAFKLAQIMKSTQTELMMSTLFFADIIGALATYFYKPKAFVSWEVITGRLKPRQRFMYKMLANRFDMVAAVSNSIHSFIINERRQDASKIRTIYYGVDLNKFKSSSKTANNKNIVFGTAARLVTQKGHAYLFEAIPRVLQEHPSAKWRFAGSGDKESKLREQVKKLGIEHAVEFLGRQEDIPAFLDSIDVFILPSLWEGFPNVLLEAMACAKPVIATSVEGTIELVINRKTGLLVPKENPAALAEAMLTLLDKPELIEQYGKNGRQRVEQHFSLQKQVSEFEALYDELLS